MKNKSDNNLSSEIKDLNKKVDDLQKSIDLLNKKLSDHIKFIDKVYEPLRNPISKIKNFFNWLMFSFFIKVLISSIIISFASWLSFKKPQISGFIVALPLVSIISLAFSFLEHQDKDKTILFAKSIVVGIPASLLFFVPFFFSKMLNLNFWTTYMLGLVFLVLGFYIHKFITQFF